MGVNTPGLNIFAGVPFLPNRATGRVYFVGNATTFVPGGVGGVDVAGAHGDSPQKPFATIDYAVGQCVAARGDVIFVLPGHVESITAAAGLDLDVAGITILFLGDGVTRGTIRFGTAVGADMDVDAANITLGAKGYDLGPRFLANIDALTGPIDVNSARFRMYGAKWYDGTTINTTDCVVADADADNMEIEDFEFVDGNAAGTQKQSFIQVAGATGVILRKIKCTGDFGTGIVENGTAWIDALLEDLVLDNASVTPTVALLLQATSTGWVRNSSLRVASGTTGYTANNDMQFDSVTVIGTDAEAGGAGAIGSTSDAAATGAVTATDTMMAYVKQLVTMMGPAAADTDTVAGALYGTAGIATFPAGVAAANAVSMAEVLRYLQENVITGTGTALPANQSLYGVLAGATGIATFPASAAPANDVSIAEVLREVYDQSAKAVTNTTAALVNATTIFTIAGGPIEILSLVARCVTGNDGTASTLQWSADPTDGAAATFSGASASLASALAGAMVVLLGTALTTAPTVAATGVALSFTGATPTNGIVVGAGIITTTIGVGSTTGTWQHHLRYRPLSRGVTVS